MKWRNYRFDTGGVWYDVLVITPRFSREWWRCFWRYAVRGNYYYYTNKWFGWRIRPDAKQQRLLKMLDELEKMP